MKFDLKIKDLAPIRKEIRDYSDKELEWCLDNLEKLDVKFLAVMCAEVLRRMKDIKR